MHDDAKSLGMSLEIGDSFRGDKTKIFPPFHQKCAFNVRGTTAITAISVEICLASILFP